MRGCEIVCGCDIMITSSLVRFCVGFCVRCRLSFLRIFFRGDEVVFVVWVGN